MHLVLPGARYGKDDRVIYDPYETFSGRSLKSSGGLPMVEFYLHRGDDRPDAARNIKDMEPLPYLIGRYYMKTLLANHRGFGILLQDAPHLAFRPIPCSTSRMRSPRPRGPTPPDAISERMPPTPT